MSMKKLLILAAAGLVSSAALAGGVGSYNAAAPALHSYTGIYIEGLAGYATTYYKDLIGTNVAADSWSHGTGNWAFGADVGYQWNKYFAAELGGVYILKSTYNDANANDATFKPWVAYLAGKVSVPVVNNVSVFGKLGLAYLKQRVGEYNGNTTLGSVANVNLGNSTHWGPMFGVGVAYHWTKALYLNAQYLRFTGKVVNGGNGTNTMSTYIPNPNVFLLGVGYKFAA